jgi:hypothetical protein
MIKRESVPSNLADWFEEATVKLDARHSKDMIVSGLQTALKYALMILYFALI